MAQIIFLNNDTIIELSDLTNGVTGAYLDLATVSVTLKDADGVEVVGAVWPMTMDYVAGSNGKYRATLPAALSLVKRGEYVAEVSASAGAGLEGYWEIPLVCQQRS